MTMATQLRREERQACRRLVPHFERIRRDLRRVFMRALHGGACRLEDLRAVFSEHGVTGLRDQCFLLRSIPDVTRVRFYAVVQGVAS